MNVYMPHETRLGGRVVLVQYIYRTWFPFIDFRFHMVRTEYFHRDVYMYRDEAI